MPQLTGGKDRLRPVVTDVEAAYEGDPSSTSFDEIIVGYPCIEAVAIQESLISLYREQLPLTTRILTECR
jgi:serine O-acetyltransferase